MDTIKSEQSSEDEMHPLDIEPQFVDMKHEEFPEPFVAIDKFEAEVGYMLHVYIWSGGLGFIYCVQEVACSLCVWAGHNMVLNIQRFGWKVEYHVQHTQILCPSGTSISKLIH